MTNRVMHNMADAAIRFAEDSLQSAGTQIMRINTEMDDSCLQERRAQMRRRFATRQLISAQSQIEAAIALLREDLNE